ncbi:MAG: hypothetical protein ABIL04_05665, partial [candidate division WOR-3 bacterium]
ENFANFPVIILDYYSPDYCHLMAGNDVLTKYTFLRLALLISQKKILAEIKARMVLVQKISY